jgi:MOSC domain-containing protein YiiM
MRSLAELERLYAERAPAPRDRGTVVLLVVRVAAGKHETPAAIEVSQQHGIVGDRWARARRPDARQQVTVMMASVAELVCDGQPLHLPGDNLLVDFDLGETALPSGARVRVGEALLEVTGKPHAGCKKFAARFGRDAMHWVNSEENLRRRLRGVNCRVIEGGQVRVDDAIARVRAGG